MKIRQWVVQQRAAFPLPMTLLVVAGALLLIAFWIRSTAFGLQATLLTDGPGIDVMEIGPNDPIPADRIGGRYVSPVHDIGGYWQMGAMLDGWPRRGLRTETIPASNLIMRGTLTLEKGGPWRFNELAPAGGYLWKVWIDGEPMGPEGRALAAGPHRIQLSVKHTAPASIVLKAARGKGKFRDVRSWHLVPDGSRAPAVAWVLAAAAAIVAGAAAYLLVQRPGERSRSIGCAKAAWPVFLVIAAMFIGTALRAHGRLTVPMPGHTWDEYQEAWQGLSLVQGESPKSWGYPPWAQFFRKFKQTTYFGRQHLIVDPYLQHPPGFSILVGLSARLDGVTEMFRVPLGSIRRVPLLLSIFFYPLLFAIARRSYGREAAALTCLLFAVAPPFVLVMRYAKGDLAVALLILVSVWAGLRHHEAAAGSRERTIWLAICGIAAGLCPWMKEIGFVALVVPAVVIAPSRREIGAFALPAFWQRIRPMVLVSGIAFGVAATQAIYGWAVSWDEFVLYWKLQGLSRLGRPDIGPVLMEVMFLNWAKQNLTVFAGGWLFLWLTAIWAARGPRRLMPGLAFLFLVALVAAVDGRWLYGWYQLPLYAPLAATAGAFMWSAVRKPQLATGLAILVVAVLPFGTFLFEIPEADRMRLLRWAVVIGAAPLGLDAVVRTGWSKEFAQLSVATLVAAFLVACIAASWQVDRFYYLGTS